MDININTNTNIIHVNDTIYLDSLIITDDMKLYEYLEDGTIAKNFLCIPFPYHIDVARNWIKYNIKLQKNKKIIFNYAIRDKEANNMLIGVISIIDISVVSGLSEVTYWLASKYRGKRIMVNVLKKLCEIIQIYKNNDIAPYKYITTLFATVFHTNTSSPKVLERCNFQFEQTLLNYYYKNGSYIDAHKYIYPLSEHDYGGSSDCSTGSTGNSISIINTATDCSQSQTDSDSKKGGSAMISNNSNNNNNSISDNISTIGSSSVIGTVKKSKKRKLV